MPILLDVESRSRAKLQDIGGRLYWEDPSTEMLCVAWHDTSTGDESVYVPGGPTPLWVFQDNTLVAHNAMGFDRFAVERTFRRSFRWIDTSQLARSAGLPGALDDLAELKLGRRKDLEGSKLTKALSRVRKGQLPEIDKDTIDRVVAYCEDDVGIMRDAWPLLEPMLQFDQDVRDADLAVNDRGVGFDRELAQALLEADEVRADMAVEQSARELGLDPDAVRAMARSPQQFCSAVGTPNARKQTVAGIDHPLVRARQALASIARGKLEAGLLRCSRDGRLRDCHRYFGAHTGRWSQKGIQLHNLPRPSKRLEKLTPEDICVLAERVIRGTYLPEQDEIALLLRATLREEDPAYTYSVQDFSGVEARMLAFRAGDSAAVGAFVRDEPVYKIMASAIFGKPVAEIGDTERTVGKIAELACGYGMGAQKFDATALAAGVDLARAGVDAGEVVAAWRAKHAPIVAFWKAVERAFRDAIRGHGGRAGAYAFDAADPDGDVVVWLPSGRPVVYRAPEDHGRSGIVLPGERGPEHTYGGKLVENLIQAECRDLLADALVRLENDGLDPVLHVHDETVCRVPTAKKELASKRHWEIMTTLPGWAAGFPVAAKGHVGRRYCK